MNLSLILLYYFKVNINLNQLDNDGFQTQLKHFRNHLHQYPELSNQEHKTQAFIENSLKNIGIASVNRVGTSLVACIKGSDSNCLPIAIRGDIDALPIHENTNAAFQSVVPGVMHACGHDVHSAWAFGAASILLDHSLKSDVYIIFQQAEELATGALSIINQNSLPDQLKAIFSAHVDPRYNLGEVVHHEGAISAASHHFSIVIEGKSAHAARPKEGVNPIPVSSQIIEKINEINNDIGNNTNFITITQINGGVQHNIIPDSVSLSGTIRCLDPSVQNPLLNHLKGLNGEHSHAKVSVTINEGSPILHNHTSLSNVAKLAIEKTLGLNSNVNLKMPNMASEDFGYFSQIYPSWYFRIGCTKVGQPFIPVHTPNFLAHEDAIVIGAKLLANAVILVDQNL